MDKDKLKKVLDMLPGTATERADYMTVEKLNKLSKFLEDFSSEMKTKTDNHYKEIQSLKGKIKPADYTALLEAIQELGKTIVTSYASSRPKDLSGFFKDMGTQLAQIGSSSKTTSELITNLKWNSSMGIRNSSGSPIDPATDAIGIGTFDYVSRTLTNSTTETYTFYKGGATGQLVATIVIVYTDSTLATVSTVTKTPVN